MKIANHQPAPGAFSANDVTAVRGGANTGGDVQPGKWYSPSDLSKAMKTFAAGQKGVLGDPQAQKVRTEVSAQGGTTDAMKKVLFGAAGVTGGLATPSVE